MAKKRNRKNCKSPATRPTQARAQPKRNNFLIRTREIAILFAFVALAFLIYFNTLDSPFILDDKDNIRQNPSIRLSQFSAENLWKAGFQGPSKYRPVSKISFALNYYFHQYDLQGYHIVNILIHITTGIFLYLFLKITLDLPSQRDRKEIYAWAPLLTVLIWLVHPVHTQSVTYIVQRMNSLATMFYILSLLLYAKARRVEKSRPRILLFAGCTVAGLLAVGSKQIAATLPFFIFLYEWYFYQELCLAWLKRHVLPLVGVLLLLAVLTLIFLGINPLDKISDLYQHRNFTPGQRALTQFRVVIFYLGLLIFPHPSRLNLDRDYALSYSLLNPITTLICMLAILGLIGLAIFLARRQPLVSFGILWFFGNLVIESSVIGLEMVFDHRTYLPSMFVVFIVILLIQRYTRPRIVGFIFLGAVATMFSFWTHERNGTWRDEVTLWQDCVNKSPNKARPHNNLGHFLNQRGRLEEAMHHYYEALRIDPGYAEPNSNLGHALAHLGQYKEASELFSKALSINPRQAEAHYGMGLALQGLGRIDEALQHFYQAIRIKPDYHKAHYHLGKALRAEGNADAVIRHFQRVIEIEPHNAAVHNNLGIVFADQGNLRDGIRHFSEAVRLKPQDADFHFNLAKALTGLGKHQEAVDHYSRAAGLNPSDAELQEALKQAKRLAPKSNIN